MKKVLLPEDIKWFNGMSNVASFRCLEDATKMFEFCKKNGIKSEWSFCRDENNKATIQIELKNADMRPYKLMCAKEKEGFDGIIVTIDTDEFEELNRKCLNGKAQIKEI